MRESSDEELIECSKGITSLKTMNVSTMIYLKHVNLTFNKLKNVKALMHVRRDLPLHFYLDTYLNSKLEQLQYLNLAYNSIVTLDGVENMRHLLILNCSHNELTTLPTTLNCDSLHELWISHNNFEVAPYESLTTLKSLRSLILSSNPFCQKNYKLLAIASLPQLNRIDDLVVTEQHRNQSKSFISSLDAFPELKKQVDTENKVLEKRSATAELKSRQSIKELSLLNNKRSTTAPPIGSTSTTQKPTTQAPYKPSSILIAKEPLKTLYPPSVPMCSYIPVISIMDAVGNLPSFKPKIQMKNKENKKKKEGIKNINNAMAPEDLNHGNIQAENWSILHSNGSVAITIKKDGSAIARWASGQLAVTCDKESCGYRVYACHSNGTIALSFDSQGTGFINYYPSGKIMLSTTSNGNGILLDSCGTIIRQWDATGNITNTNGDNDVQGSGLIYCTTLGENLGVRVSLENNKLNVDIYYSYQSIRHKLGNYFNPPVDNSDECHHLFGKLAQVVPNKQKAKLTHDDLLQKIRQATSSL